MSFPPIPTDVSGVHMHAALSPVAAAGGPSSPSSAVVAVDSSAQRDEDDRMAFSCGVTVAADSVDSGALASDRVLVLRCARGKQFLSTIHSWYTAVTTVTSIAVFVLTVTHMMVPWAMGELPSVFPSPPLSLLDKVTSPLFLAWVSCLILLSGALLLVPSIPTMRPWPIVLFVVTRFVALGVGMAYIRGAYRMHVRGADHPLSVGRYGGSTTIAAMCNAVFMIACVQVAIEVIFSLGVLFSAQYHVPSRAVRSEKSARDAEDNDGVATIGVPTQAEKALTLQKFKTMMEMS